MVLAVSIEGDLRRASSSFISSERKLGEILVRAAKALRVSPFFARYLDKFAMQSLYAHSEQNRKPLVRHLRRAVARDVRYAFDMQLRIKEMRKERGWTVEHLADLVGLSKSYVSEIENGKKQANQTRISKFADAFGVDVFDLLDDETFGPDERELLKKFTRLDPANRKTLLTIADSLKD